MLGVVPGEEGLAVRAGVLDAAEALGELGAVLHGLELRLAHRESAAQTHAVSGAPAAINR